MAKSLVILCTTLVLVFGIAQAQFDDFGGYPIGGGGGGGGIIGAGGIFGGHHHGGGGHHHGGGGYPRCQCTRRRCFPQEQYQGPCRFRRNLCCRFSWW